MSPGIKNSVAFLLIHLFFSGQSQEIVHDEYYKDARQYYDVFRSVFSEIQEKSWDYTRAAAHGKSSQRTEEKRKQVTASIENGIVRIFELLPYDGSMALRDSALRFLRMQYAVSNEDFSRLVNMEKIAEHSYDAMEAYMKARELADARAKKAGEMFNQEFALFVVRHNIVPVPESDAEKKLAIAARVYEYYNLLYRVFFNTYKQESYLIEAMGKNDVSGIEQNRDALARTSAQALSDLLAIPAYQEDTELKKALEQVLLFYQDEAENKLKDISLFFVANDNFQKVILSFNNVAAAEHSVEESMLFNKALAEHKATTENYMKLSAQVDKDRRKVLSQWHEACDRFIKRHIPKS
jgi:hypothetical protein